MGFSKLLIFCKKYVPSYAKAETRTHLDTLAQRITPAANWSDLVMPEDGRQVLLRCAAEIRERRLLYSRRKSSSMLRRDKGSSLLVVGGSERDRMMAAKVLASDLHLRLYRIDLSSVVSRYIGETEKNLRRVFDAAESSGAVLLIDEADALFGKRSDVKDSHDRYANIEVNYLLQGIEQYQPLAILGTNLGQNLDDTLISRFCWIVQLSA